MKKRFSSRELFEVRNFVPVDMLIRDELQIPSKISEGVFRFLCPICNEFRTSTKSTTNLARCFLCERNFNTIDLVIIVRRKEFRESVKYLKTILKKVANQNKDVRLAMNSILAGIGKPMSEGLR